MANLNKENPQEAHYTPQWLIDELFNLLEEYFDTNNITELLENSAGDGRIIEEFIKRYNKPYIAFDIDPQPTNPKIIINKENYLKKEIEYKPGRIAIINPPFSKGTKFCLKAVKESDFVVAITAKNTLLNLDYEKIWLEKAYVYKKVDFNSCKVGIAILIMRKKTKDDKYEWE